jgi:hypothetical protein
VIADVIELGHFLTVVVPEGPAAELRRLSQARERAIERQGRLENQLHGLIFLLFPEFWGIMKGIKSKSARYLARRYQWNRIGVKYLLFTYGHSIW